MKTIKMRCVDWWEQDTKENFYKNPFIQALSQKYNIEYSNKPDFLLYGPFGQNNLQFPKEVVRIFYTGENTRTDWNIADYGIDFDFMDFGDRHLCMPLFFLPGECGISSRAITKHLRAEQIFQEKREKFCAFLVSNGSNHIRNTAFKKLCAYKKVDSGGRYLNNIGGRIGDRFKDFEKSKYEWLLGYKFNLCFENSSYPGYVTEKILQAYEAGCIPIYWGDSTLCDVRYAKYRPTFNPKAFVNAHDFANLDELVQEVRRIDNDNEAYLAMLKEPIFLDSTIDTHVLGGGGQAQAK
ncbi:glycosyltransferase family 10 domain-containing protein [Helicobacter fennelliae]|nr:glycosyltransferase family 10 [Helicobacter fennelliae]